MSANIFERDIQTGLSQAWHGMTNIVECINRENSGIDYDMDIVPLYIDGKDGEKIETDHRQIISLDDCLPIGKPVSNAYCLISNPRIWDMVNESLAGTKHDIVSVGTVDDRSKGFITVKLDEDFQAASRNTEPLFNILWGHGGNIALIARSSFTVTVCANTFAMNLGRKGKDLNLSVKHTKNALTRIEGMEDAIETYCGVKAEFELAMNSLEAQPCNEENARKIIGGILAPVGFESKELSQRGKTRMANTVDRLSTLFMSGAGNTGSNLCDVFQASTDYFTHESSGGDNPENAMRQFVSSEFGSGQRMKELFFDTLTDEDELGRVTSRGEKVLLAMAS